VRKCHNKGKEVEEGGPPLLWGALLQREERSSDTQGVGAWWEVEPEVALPGSASQVSVARNEPIPCQSARGQSSVCISEAQAASRRSQLQLRNELQAVSEPRAHTDVICNQEKAPM
jgi:hypothetical protein